MKLYSLDLSAFAARCRVVIRERQLPVDFVSPPGGLRSAEYAAISPLGKVPALITDSGGLIIESDVICEYLEDVFAQRPLRPTDPVEVARMRVMIRIVDNYIAPPLGRLLGASDGIDPRSRSRESVQADVTAYQAGATGLARFMSDEGYALGGSLSIADAAITTMLAIAKVAFRLVDRDFVEGQERLRDYVQFAGARPSIAETIGEQVADLPPHFAAIL